MQPLALDPFGEVLSCQRQIIRATYKAKIAFCFQCFSSKNKILNGRIFFLASLRNILTFVSLVKIFKHAK